MVESIYDSGRTHVFHAKTGRDFYLPHGAKRHEIQHRFTLLQRLIASLLRERLGQSIAAGWGAMSQAVTDAQNRVYGDVDQIFYEGIGAFSLQNVRLNLVDSPRRFGELWAYSVTARPLSLVALSRIVYKKQVLNISGPS